MELCSHVRFGWSSKATKPKAGAVVESDSDAEVEPNAAMENAGGGASREIRE